MTDARRDRVIAVEKCRLCGERTDSRIEMRRHIMQDHSSAERFDALHETTAVEHTNE